MKTLILKLMIILSGCIASQHRMPVKADAGQLSPKTENKLFVIKDKNRKANGSIMILYKPASH